MGKSVLLALSGGLDSTVTAILLKKQGYKVYGIHFALYTDDNKEKQEELNGITKKLDIPLYLLDIKNTFNNTVVKYFTTEYLNGRTPCPCSFCNMNIKWDALYKYAEKKGIDYIATGHYVKKTSHNSVPRIKQSEDIQKDQSYFLWGLPPRIISKSITPLGNFLKSEVRDIARSNGFTNLASKPESMGVCFLSGENYRDFLRSRINSNKKGPVLTADGNYVSEHKGIYNFTIGQKKDISNLQRGYCVTQIDAENNSIIVGPWDNLFYNTIRLKNCLTPSLPKGYHYKMKLMIRGFGKNPQKECTILIERDNKTTVYLVDPAWAPMYGQPAAIYKDDVLLGGGYLYDYYNR